MIAEMNRRIENIKREIKEAEEEYALTSDKKEKDKLFDRVMALKKERIILTDKLLDNSDNEKE